MVVRVGFCRRFQLERYVLFKTVIILFDFAQLALQHTYPHTVDLVLSLTFGQSLCHHTLLHLYCEQALSLDLTDQVVLHLLHVRPEITLRLY